MRKNAITPRTIDKFGCSSGLVTLFVGQGCAQLCIVTTSNSTAGLRNSTSPDTISRDLLETTVVRYNAPLLQSSSSDAARDHVRVQFATMCSSRANVWNLTCDVGLPLARVYSWTSSYIHEAVAAVHTCQRAVTIQEIPLVEDKENRV